MGAVPWVCFFHIHSFHCSFRSNCDTILKRKGVFIMQRLQTQIKNPVFSRVAKFAVVGFCVLTIWILFGAPDALAQTAFDEFADASTLSQDF